MQEVVVNSLTLDMLLQAFRSAAGNVVLVVLIINIFVDIITGHVKNAIYHTKDSSAGLKGLSKHATITFVSYMFAVVASIINLSWMTVLVDVAIALVAVEYLQSIAENLGVMGFKYPKVLAYKVEKEIEEKTKLKEEAEELKNNRGV